MTTTHHPPEAFLPPAVRPELHEAAAVLAVKGTAADRAKVRGEVDLLTPAARAWLDERADERADELPE